MWNHYDNLSPRTNNSAEGFHSKLNRMINKSKTNFYEILNHLKKIQLDNELEIRRILSGGAPRSRKKCYINSDETISRLKEMFKRKIISLV